MSTLDAGGWSWSCGGGSQLFIGFKNSLMEVGSIYSQLHLRMDDDISLAPQGSLLPQATTGLSVTTDSFAFSRVLYEWKHLVAFFCLVL
jgi:hypothetical protein